MPWTVMVGETRPLSTGFESSVCFQNTDDMGRSFTESFRYDGSRESLRAQCAARLDQILNPPPLELAHGDTLDLTPPVAPVPAPSVPEPVYLISKDAFIARLGDPLIQRIFETQRTAPANVAAMIELARFRIDNRDAIDLQSTLASDAMTLFKGLGLVDDTDIARILAPEFR